MRKPYLKSVVFGLALAGAGLFTGAHAQDQQDVAFVRAASCVHMKVVLVGNVNTVDGPRPFLMGYAVGDATISDVPAAPLILVCQQP